MCGRRDALSVERLWPTGVARDARTRPGCAHGQVDRIALQVRSAGGTLSRTGRDKGGLWPLGGPVNTRKLADLLLQTLDALAPTLAAARSTDRRLSPQTAVTCGFTLLPSWTVLAVGGL